MSGAQDWSQLKQRNAMVTEANNKLQTQLDESERQEQEHRSHSKKLDKRINALNTELTVAYAESETAAHEHRSQVVELNKHISDLKEQVSVLQEHIETLKRQGDEGLAAHAKTKEDWHVQRIQQEQYVLELQAQAREHTKELQESAVKLEQCEREVKKQISIARAHSLWQQAELENRRQTIQIRRLEDLLRHEDPEKTPPCSPPTI